MIFLAKKLHFSFLLTLIFISLTFYFIAADIQAQISIDNTGLDTTAKEGGLDTNQKSLPTLIGKVIGAGLSFIGILFFILMIYAGFTWMIARGNEQEVTKAKEMLNAAIIGLIIVISAYAITKYIGSTLFEGR